MTDEELVFELGELGRAIAYPAVPADFAARIVAETSRRATTGRQRIADPAWVRNALGGRSLRRALILALVALAIAALAAAALGLGVPGIRIVLGPAPSVVPAAATPTGATPRASATAAAPAPTWTLVLGRPVTLDQARAGAGFRPLVPTDPAHAQPDGIYLAGVPPLASVSLAFDDRVLITELDATIDTAMFAKFIDAGTTVQTVSVGGSTGYWIEGPHELRYLTADGSDRWEQVHITDHVLVWQHGEVSLRLETTLSREEALAVAASMR